MDSQEQRKIIYVAQVDIKSEKPIIKNMYVPKRINKGDYHYKVFPTLVEAQQYCVERMEDHVRRLDTDLRKSTLALRSLRTEMENG
jgi:hypothetical protein